VGRPNPVTCLGRGCQSICEVRWLPVPGFEDRYLVSDTGVVLCHDTDFFPTIRRDREGYCYVRLSNGHRPQHQRFVHQLVLEAFVGPRQPGQQTRHLDGDKCHNFVENLAWGTPAENGQDSARLGTLKGTGGGNAKLDEEMVREIRASWESDAALAKKLNVTPQNIWCVRKRISWQHVV
jgi:hypothetical protein